MTIIPIDRSTIQPYPNRKRAGQPVVECVGPMEVTFKFDGPGCIPAELLDKVYIVNWRNSATPETGTMQYGYIINPNDTTLFLDIDGIQISSTRPIRETFYAIHSDPMYKYEYEPTPVKCEKCGDPVLHTEILEAEVEMYEDEYFKTYDKCPKCGCLDTFEYEYEKIENVKL